MRNRARHAVTGLVATLALASVALAAPAQAATGAEGEQSGHGNTQAALERLADSGVPGVGAMSRDTRGSWFGQAGAADVETGRERTPGDHFRAGSITKTFTATVLLQLEAEGELSLDDTVEDWLPGVVSGNGNDGGQISLRQLLRHTSGLYNYTEDPKMREQMSTGFFEHRYDTFTPEELVATALQHKPNFEPGTDWSYSNTGYVLAGMVIEKATGKPYANEVGERVLKPLGLKETSVPRTDPTLPAPHPVGYSTLLDPDPDAEIHDATELNPSWAGTAGEVITTGGDLNRFYAALLRGDLLPKAQQSAMFDTVPVEEGAGIEYGLGIAGQTLSCGTTVWGHDGGIHGSLSQAAGLRDASHVFTLNMNGDWLPDGQAYLDVFEAEFCGKQPGGTAGSPTPDRPATPLAPFSQG